jgi:hypothetical protein
MNMIYNDNSVSIEKRLNHFFIRYDAGAHQIEMREDEITENEFEQILANPAMIEIILISLQNRISNSGRNPYKSNIEMKTK